MHVNGRLTAPPLAQAVLVTDSVRCISLEGRLDVPEALGISLDTFSFGNSSGSRRLRSAGPSPLKFFPVSAAHGLSATGEVAARS
jgi:hypothetical protein